MKEGKDMNQQQVPEVEGKHYVTWYQVLAIFCTLLGLGLLYGSFYVTYQEGYADGSWDDARSHMDALTQRYYTSVLGD